MEKIEKKTATIENKTSNEVHGTHSSFGDVACWRKCGCSIIARGGQRGTLMVTVALSHRLVPSFVVLYSRPRGSRVMSSRDVACGTLVDQRVRLHASSDVN